MTQDKEGRKYQQMKEVWNLWRNFLHKIVGRCSRKYHKPPGFHQHQYSVCWQKICRKENFVPDGSLTAWLLNRNAWKLQHYWNKDLALKVKHSRIELSLLAKRGLETLNRGWNRSQTSGEVQPPHDPKNFDERNQRSNKWWSWLIITEESSWQSFKRNKCDSSVLSWLDANIAQKNAQKPTWLARGWATYFARRWKPAPGEGCDRFAKYMLVGSVTSRAIQFRRESTGLRLIPRVKRAHAWTPLSLPGRRFYSGYPSHPRTEQK